MEKYPKKDKDGKLQCWNCGEEIGNEKSISSGYPAGGYQIKCPKCLMWTFFDLEVD